MDIQLQELIDKIKKDGVASAESKAQEIIAEAEKKAQAIISSAEEKADAIIKNGKLETERMEKASVDAIRQAGRNLLISFRDGINAQLNALISKETEKVYNSDILKNLIPEVVKNWASKDDVNSLTVLLSEKDLNVLEKNLGTALKDQLNSGLEIKVDKNLSNGFRIGTKDGSAYYDFSAESVADLFASYLNPKNAAIMKEAAKEGL